MIAIVFIAITLIATIIHVKARRYTDRHQIAETLLSYLLLINFGVMGLLAAYSHVFNADEIARNIGWPTGSPFQFEIGMTNLAIGVMCIGAYWKRGSYWMAAITMVTILFIGCFVGHIIQYQKGDTAPYNIGPLIWIGDLAAPLLALGLYLYIRKR